MNVINNNYCILKLCEVKQSFIAIDGNILCESSTERYRDKEMFRVAKGNVDGARQRIIGNCAGLFGPLPLIASYFTKSNRRPHSRILVCVWLLLYTALLKSWSGQ